MCSTHQFRLVARSTRENADTVLDRAYTHGFPLQLESVNKVGKAVQPPAASKSLQSCRTLCDPIDGSPPGSPIPGIL